MVKKNTIIISSHQVHWNLEVDNIAAGAPLIINMTRDAPLNTLIY